MPGAPDLAHAALTQSFFEPVAPQLARPLDLGAEIVDHPGTHIGHRHNEQVGEYEAKEELVWAQLDGSSPRCEREPDNDRHRADRGQGGKHRPARRSGHDYGEQHRPDGDPGEPQRPAPFAEPSRVAELGGDDAVAARDLEYQRDIHHRTQRNPVAPDYRGDHQRHGNRDYAGAPMNEAPQKVNSVLPAQ